MKTIQSDIQSDVVSIKIIDFVKKLLDRIESLILKTALPSVTSPSIKLPDFSDHINQIAGARGFARVLLGFLRKAQLQQGTPIQDTVLQDTAQQLSIGG